LYAAWTVKYKPKSSAEIVGNSEAIAKFVEWIKSWEKGVPKKRAVFLYGSPGIGKTVTVEVFSSVLSMEFVETNASDYRTEDAVNRFAGLASQFGSLFGGRRLVLLDEIDGLTGTSDRGGVKAITEVVKNARGPVVLTANNAYEPRFAALRAYCLMLEFKKPSAGDVVKHLKRICEGEKLPADEAALKFIAQRSEGDVRSAVNDLQALGQGKERLTYEDVSWLGHRDRQDTIFNVLRMIMYAKTCSGAKQAVDLADVDIDFLFEWIYENVPSHFTDPHDLAKAMDALAVADIYRGRIRRTQEWGLLRYVIDFMTAGVAMARKNTHVSGFVPFRFPERIQMLSRSRAERAIQREIGVKIKAKNHISVVRATKEFIPYLKIIFQNNVEMAAGLAKWLHLNEEMIRYLTGNDEKTKEILE